MLFIRQYFCLGLLIVIISNEAFRKRQYGTYKHRLGGIGGYEFTLKVDHTFIYRGMYKTEWNSWFEEMSVGNYNMKGDTVVLNYSAGEYELFRPPILLWRGKKLYYTRSDKTGKFLDYLAFIR
jgi:hypothetical protein